MADRSFGVRIAVDEENDGATYLRRGAERRIEMLTVDEAVKSYTREPVVCVLRLALEALEKTESDVVREAISEKRMREAGELR
jgi:hypothetical protein